MKRIIVILVVSVAGLTSCAGSSPPSVPEATSEANTQGATPSAEPTVSEPPPGCDDLPLGMDSYTGRRVSRTIPDAGGRVPALANIFGAGLDAPPSPGGGGGGVLPPVSLLPSGSSRVVTFPRVAGLVQGNPNAGPEPNHPAGDGVGPTDVESLLGISGIVHRTNFMFLSGVFLTDARPSNPAPPRLDFSDYDVGGSQDVWVPDGDRFERLEPEIGQTFLIGDGEDRSFVVPAEATRLFLGFADAFLNAGCPGWYGNNSGHLTVTVEVTER